MKNTLLKLREMMAREWELVALVVCALAFLLTLVSALFGQAENDERGTVTRKMPIPDPLVNRDVAYAMIDKQAVSQWPDASHPFRSGLSGGADGQEDNGSKDTQKRASKKRDKKNRQPRTKRNQNPQTKPETDPAEQDPEKNNEAAASEKEDENGDNNAKPAYHTIVYEGYRTTRDGTPVAVIHNRTSGKRFVLKEGSGFRGMMVGDFTDREVTFITPRGRERVLKANVERRIPAP